jgi:Na+/proline symporter
MQLLGLHLIDLAVILLYIIVVLGIGHHLAKRTKSEDDFFLGGRKLGKLFQFFLSFGAMTDPSGATAASSSVSKQGIGGVWLVLIPLFMTPYYWFMNVWFRRVRLTTNADLFQDRFGSRLLPAMLAVVSIGISILGIGFGNIIALKTLQPIMVKAESEYTVQDHAALADYQEYHELQRLRETTPLDDARAMRYGMLKDMSSRGMLHPYVSYITPLTFYLASSALVTVFIVLGGLTASAMVDAVQAVLMVIISVILIPFGLARIGGFAALHRIVPAHMFDLFGGAQSEFTWYSIVALLLMTMVGIHAAGNNMNVSGSAKNELAARLGAVTGGFAKRFMTMAWGYTGLIGVALFGANIANPDLTWGMLSRTLLPPGLIGVMIIGILGGKLAALGIQSVVNSAFLVKNLYEPLFPGKSEAHYMVVARLTVPTLLAFGIAVALYNTNALSLLKFMMAISVTWGAPIFLMFQWKRLTKVAVLVQVLGCLLFIAIIPIGVSLTPWLRTSEALTVMTEPRPVEIKVRATPEDVAAGRASVTGEKIFREMMIEPVSVFFEDGVAHTDPSNPSSSLEGLGRFNIEVYVASLAGLDARNLTPPQLLTLRFLINAILPFAMLISVSLLTPRDDPARVARFYVRLKTPVGVTPEADAAAVAESYANPTRFDHTKLFPKSDWEFTRWDRQDAVGFLACCAFTIFIILLFQAVLRIGA